MYKGDQPPVGLSAQRIERFVLEHGPSVLRVARAYCKTAADADDVYQRTLEIVMIKAPNIDGAELVAWACTVARNEALTLQRGPRGAPKADFDAISEQFESELPTPEESLLDDELLGQGRELLGRLRPDQVRCLLMRADELSYPEICERTGFSYAKVNRLLSEGRKALKTRHQMLESGSECRRLEDALSEYADGVASAQIVAEIELHLEHCIGCRATVRDYRAAAGRVSGYLPLGVLAIDETPRGILARVADHAQSLFAQLQERIFGHVSAGQSAAELATAKKIAAIAAIGGSLVAGGAAIEHSRSGDAKERSRESASAPARLVDPVHLTAADRSRARAARSETARPRAATDDEVDGDDSGGGIDTAPPLDQTVPADQAPRAADPADQAPEGAQNDPQPVNDGVGP